MKNKRNLLLVIFLLGTICLSGLACKKKGKNEDPPAEVVTNLNLVLDAPKGKLDVIVAFNDIKGINGKTSPNTITLDANTVYTGVITLEDETATPKADVTNAYTIGYRVVGADVTITPNGKTPQVQTRTATNTNTAKLEVILNKNGKNSTTVFPLVVKP